MEAHEKDFFGDRPGVDRWMAEGSEAIVVIPNPSRYRHVYL
jgi:hypothetical protein